MEALDGNAIGGILIDIFGTEMTTAATVCSNCGGGLRLAEQTVYNRAPGIVVRCRTCESILWCGSTSEGLTVSTRAASLPWNQSSPSDLTEVRCR